jgi:TonB-linked SusC/RagA family outer membrane protein
VGVSVLIVGTSTGTVTNVDGEYILDVPDDARLRFSYIGYIDQEVEIGNRSIINIVMAADIRELQEVVVTSLGITREKMALGYSVEEVDGENFTEAREMNLANALSGRIAGVNVSNIATGPAGSSRVIIRGNASLDGNNQPLYVVDGIRIDNFTYTQAGMWGGADQGDGTTSINPDDIESITVLKGASAAALYGSRASNGVILITTKQGKKGQALGIEFNSNFVAETIIDQTEYQTIYGHGDQGRIPADEVEGEDWGDDSWGGVMDGSMVYGADGRQYPYEYQGSNLKKFYENGWTWTNSLALSGGGQKQTYRLGASYMWNNSPIPNAHFNRTNISINTTGDYGKLQMGAKILYSHEDVKNRPRISDSPGNAPQAVYRLPPSMNVENYKGDPDKPGAIYTIYDDEGNVIDRVDNPSTRTTKIDGEELLPWSNKWLQNPYWSAYQYEMNSVRDRIIGHVQLRFDFTDWLYILGRAGMDYQARKQHNVIPYGTSYLRKGNGGDWVSQIRETNYEWMLGFNKLYGKLGINAFIGGSAMIRIYRYDGYYVSNYNIPF